MDIPKLKSSVKLHAPVLWRLLRHTAWTNQQEEHTLIKTPDFVSLECCVLRAWTDRAFFRLSSIRSARPCSCDPLATVSCIAI
jgi:hypothetical protein